MSTPADSRRTAALGAVGEAGRRLLSAGPVTLARMGGSSIVEPSAAGWATDFLNAAYYARPRERRDVEDLRIALCVLTTRWQRLGRRLRLGDLGSFHRAFGSARLRGGGAGGRLTLGRDALMEGAEHLLGPGFADAYGDESRRAHGIVFASSEELHGFAPEARLRDAALRSLTPPRRPLGEQTWHTYPAVPLPSAEAALELLGQTERWPDFACELGRFTALRRGGLLHQTFEIEVAVAVSPRTPAFMRAYVTATKLLTRGAELDSYASELARHVACLPSSATPFAAVELTTHEGHFMGRGLSRLLIFEHEGRAFLRDVGSWDPMPPHLALPYKLKGEAAQWAFWGGARPEQSLLHQVARRAAP
jgi:hypothetical protein